VKARLIRGLDNIIPAPAGRVITIGNFDGVHLGHQALLAKVREKAQDLKLPSLVMTFEPQPFEFFAKGKCAPRLTRCREKFCLLTQYGIDQVLVVNFNEQFAAVSADQFTHEILGNALRAKYVMVGDDFRYGHARQGSFATLKEAGKQIGFEVAEMPTVVFSGERVSSTRVRNALLNADHVLAEQLLGRPYAMIGRVVHGDKRGRTLGFPTANIYLHRAETPVHGIYVVRMHGIANKPLPGVANVGTRPAVGGTRSLLEVYLFNFSQEIYGRHVSVEFCEKLRDEEYYPNLELLTEQITKDAAKARHYFEMRGEL